MGSVSNIFFGCFLLILSVRAWTQTAAVQPPTLYFNTIGKAEGLASGKVRDILQDRKGFIYLTSTAGIERFDGYSLSHFQFPGNPDLTALMDQETRACLQDGQGKFWIITDFNGLFEYDPAYGTSNRYLHEEKATLYLIDFILDKQGKYLWLATNDGIARFGLADKKVEFFMKGDFFLTVFEDKSGVIWAGTIANGIRSLNPVTGKIAAWLPKNKTDKKTFPGFYCRSIVQDINGDMLFAADVGFFRMNLRNGKTKGYFNDPLIPDSYPGSNTSDLLVDSRGQLWVGTFGNGLALFDRKRELFFNYQRKPSMVGSLSGNAVECLFEDATGQIWVGDHARGVSYFSGNTGFITTLELNKKKTLRLPLQQINCLLACDKELWLGLPQGLAAYSTASGTLTMVPFKHEVTCLKRLNTKDLLVGTKHGVFRFKPASGSFSAFLPDSLGMNSHVLSMMLAGDSALWFSTADAKLWQVGLNSGKVRRFEAENKLPRRAECNALYQTRSGRLCFGSYGGFCEYDAALDTFISNGVPGYWSAQGNAVSDICEDDFGTIWIARYGGGLDAFEPEKRRYRHFGLEDGLPDMFCTTVQRDNYGRLWVGTENGLAVFTSKKEVFEPATKIHFKAFYTEDGLPSNQISRSAVFQFSEQQGSRQLLYFGSEDGLSEVRPELLEFNKTPPVPILTSFYLFNHLLKPADNGILKLPIEATTKLILPPKQNFFTLEFSTLNFLSPEKNHYRYLLEGYDPDWVDAGARHSASYTAVSPGSYTFRLEVFNNDGVVSLSPLALHIKILPAWHETRWFTGLVVGTMVILAFAYFRWRLVQLRKVEIMRQAIAADLHDEVGASLTSIQILAQLAANGDPQRRNEALEKLPEQVRNTSASLREIVWNIQPKHDALHLLLSELTRHAGEVFEKSDIQYSVQSDEFPEGVALDPVTRQHFTRIFKEILSNLVRHSGAGRAAVFFKKENQHLVLLVRDDGKGFEIAKVQRGNGLDNMERRAVAAGGSLAISSSAGEGTEITLQLPLKRGKSWRNYTNFFMQRRHDETKSSPSLRRGGVA